MTTPALQLPLLATNQAQPDVTVNDALLMLDAAFGGEVTIYVTDDDAIAIGTAGIPAEWQYSTIIIGDPDTLLTGAQDVIWPDVQRRSYFSLRNSTAQNLTIKRAGQTGVLIVAGGEATVRDNGTDIIAPASAPAVETSDVANDSSVSGATASDALNILLGLIMSAPLPVYTRGAAWSNNGQPLVAVDANVVYQQVQTSGTITGWTLLTDGGLGDCEIDVWKGTFANYPPTDADSIVAFTPPSITAGIKGTDSTLTGWTTSVSAGDVLAFRLMSSSNFTYVSLQLEIQP